MKPHRPISAAKRTPAGRCYEPNTTTAASSGGHTDRPALQRLLEDVRSGKIDVIVVYKVDRLTRLHASRPVKATEDLSAEPSSSTDVMIYPD